MFPIHTVLTKEHLVKEAEYLVQKVDMPLMYYCRQLNELDC